MKIDMELERGFVNRGNQARIKAVMKKAAAGEPITVAFLGGSITQGSQATKQELCYASRVYEWWKAAFPKSEITLINGGIGATDSQFGCARAKEDILSAAPDMVQIEFAVNDECNEHYRETFEGVVRQIFGSEKKPAVMLMYNVFYDSGMSAELEHAKIARHYDLPAVSMRSTIYPLLLSGQLENRLITADDLHPNDLGHELVAQVITDALSKIKDSVDEPEAAEQTYPAPLTKNRYEGSVRYRNANADAIITGCSGFTADETPQEQIRDVFRKGWTASEKNAFLEFKVKAGILGVQYRRTISLPAPIARVTVDGDEQNAKLLDANFDETWGDKLCLDTLLESDTAAEHTVRVELVETHPDDQLPFYLVSLIAG